MKKSDIDRLLEGRRITEEYERDYPTQGKTAAWSYINNLQKLDFNSPTIFRDHNDQMNRQAFSECVILDGQCDFCEGYGHEPPCYQTFKRDSALCIRHCFVDKTAEEAFAEYLKVFKDFVGPDQVREIIFGFMRIGYVKVDIDKTKRHGIIICPPGHGFSLDLDKQKDLPFDIHWSRR